MAPRLEYFVGETFASLRRNLLLTLAAISTVAVSLLLLGVVMVVDTLGKRAIGGIEKEVEVNVYLREDITPDQSKELQRQISGMPEVRTVRYISKEEALKSFKATYKDSPSMWETLGNDALPASYLIELKDPKRAEDVTARLDGQPGVDEVSFGGDNVKKVLTIISILRRGGFAFVAIILGGAILLIANTIRLAVYARRKEIGIMKLVGATNWFVRVPFMFEGMAEGALGALLAGVLIIGTKLLFLDGAQATLPFFPITVGFDVLVRILGLLIGVGMAVGALGSALALRKFLEV